MPKTVPTPVSAAIGLVPTVLGGVRRLPTKAVQLPILALSTALNGVELARREYDELSLRGERLVARLRGTSFDELEDRFEDSLAGTRLAKPYDKVEDALEDAADALRSGARKARAATSRPGAPALTTVPSAKPAAAEPVAAKPAAAKPAAAKPVAAKPAAAKPAAAKPAAPAAVTATDVPAAEQPKGVPTPKATEPDMTRVDTAATPDVLAAVEEVAASIAVPTDLTADALPLDDYDHLTLGALRGRLRSLDVDQLVTLRAYEKSKADRLPVVTMLDNRIAKLAAGDAQPSGGTVESASPKASTATKPPKKVGSPAAAKNDAPPHTKVRLT